MSSSSYKPSLIGQTLEQLQTFCHDHQQPRFRAQQLWQWLYVQGASDISLMSNLGNQMTTLVQQHYSLNLPTISEEQQSSDGTVKWLVKFDDGREVEMVYIPETHRGTLCVSSQVGCSLTCSFCHTGTQRMVRNLTASEIIAQVMLARKWLNDWPSTKEQRKLTNIVFMGMGEPLLNYDHVKHAISLLIDPQGMAFSKRKITLSTSGIVPNMVTCGEELGINLAVSLHATTDELRNELVPINKKHPLDQLIKACKNYPASSDYRRITFEYVMLDGVNDSDEDAKRLISLLSDLPAKINLIPFNPWPGSKYLCSSPERIEKFSNILKRAGLEAPVRTPRGQDILAACGQLKSASEIKKKSSG